ncbi:hypothetical protein HYV50_02240 [Candidatus Pacearchaeota archaeon]|nr:hypothetical protein [Candidatus Pacearchaeota archaeon]
MNLKEEESRQEARLHKVYNLFIRNWQNSSTQEYGLYIHEESGVLAKDCNLKYIGFCIPLSDISLKGLAQQVADDRRLRIVLGDDIITIPKEYCDTRESYIDFPVSEEKLNKFRDIYIGIEEEILQKLAEKRLKERREVEDLRGMAL